MKLLPNIERDKFGRFRACITRRPRIFRSRWDPDLSKAIAFRDDIERRHAKRPTSVPSGRPWRTNKMLRQERLARGLCQECGETPCTDGYKTCAMCRMIWRIKRG